MILNDITIHLMACNNGLRLLTGLIGGIGLAILLKAIKWMVISFKII